MSVGGTDYRHGRHGNGLVRTILRGQKRLGAGVLAALQTTTPIQMLGFFTICLLILANSISLQQNGDGILLSVMSIQRLTPYYWAQDRYGNLTPLLAAWIHNPLYNVYAQLFLQLVAGLIAPVFYCSLVFRRAADVWRAALLTDALLLIAGNDAQMREIYSVGNPYAVSLACAGLASLVLRAGPVRFGRTLLMPAAAVGLLAAYMVNFGMIIIALPLVGLFALLLPSPGSVRLLIIHLLAAVVSYLLPGIVAPQYRTDMGLSPSAHNIAHYVAVIWHSTGWPFALIVFVPSATILLYLVWSRRLRALRLYLVLLAAMSGVAALDLSLVASSNWLVFNLFHIRYFVPGYLLLVSVAGVSLWLIPMVSLRGRALHGAAFAGLATVLLLAAHQRLPGRGISNVDIIGDGRGVIARAVAARYVSLSLDGIAGDYWYVWPAVLMAEQYHYDTGFAGPNVLGVAYRGRVRREEFVARLAAQGRLRLACFDLAPVDCAASTSSEMEVPGLHVSEFLPMERLPGEHRLWFVDVTATETPT